MPSLSTQVLLGILAGIGAGLFLGELVTPVSVVGNVFIGLLQMTVLPYILVSLIGGLGRLRLDEARLLGARGGRFILLFWAIGLGTVACFPLAFPDWEAATFFSSSLAEVPEPIDIVGLYIPSNPFYALTNSIVPAIVLFSLAVGLALIATPRKEALLDTMDVFGDVIMRTAQAVVRLAPVGVFALVAVAAGTMDVRDLGRLQVYLLTYIGLALVLTFWVLPALVSTLTPIPYRRVIGATQDALLTAFATGNLLIVLPLLSERVKELLQEIRLRSDETDSAADLLVPINFNLPNLGKLLSLAFVLFAGWFAGAGADPGRYPAFLASGLFSFFGEVVVALPFLLDFMRVPADMFQIFVAVDVFTGRFGTLVAGMHTVALALLVAASVSGGTRIRKAALVRYVGVSVLLVVGVLGGLRLFYERVVPQEYRQYEQLVGMDLAIERVQVAEVDPDTTLAPGDARGRGRLARILRRGSLRVGYLPGSLPFVFRNQTGKLVGMEVDLAHMLARNLGVTLEFVELDRPGMAASLDTGRADILMTGLFVTPERALRMRFAEPYMQGTLALVVPDHERHRFASGREIREREDLRIAALDLPYYRSMLKQAFPRAAVERVGSPREFFKAEPGRYDALLFSAEAGSAWTLVHPQFSVVIPKPRVVRTQLAFALPRPADKLAAYVDTWVSLRAQDGAIEALYDYWILGQGAEPDEPRWSVVRNLLGWVD